MAYQLNMSVEDQMAAEIRAYADRAGISLAAAVRVLLRRALDAERPRAG